MAQLKAWLADQDVPMESLAKKLVQEKAANTEGLADYSAGGRAHAQRGDEG